MGSTYSVRALHADVADGLELALGFGKQRVFYLRNGRYF